MNLKFTSLVFVLFFTSISLINAQCPEVKKVNSIANSITLTVSKSSTYTAAILYKVENTQPFADIDNKPNISQNNITFNNVLNGNYIIRVNEKGCKPLFVGKENNIIVK